LNKTIVIPNSFKKYIDPTVVRFEYLYPKLVIKFENSEIIFSNFEDEKLNFDEIKKEFFHQLYKEKIYSDTLEIRKKIYGVSK